MATTNQHYQESALHYPNLTNCSVKLKGPTVAGAGEPPKPLPIECKSACHVRIPAPYDFSLEKNILKKKEEREKDISATKSGQNDLERAVLVKMKSVTGADEDVCIALLEENSYDLKTSIEMFFQSRT